MPGDNSVSTNRYSVLTLIALIGLLGGCIFVAMTSNKLFGNYIPQEGNNLAIEGKIAQIQSSGDTATVQIDVGSSDAVKQGMVFQVHRDDWFLGSVKIDSVSSDSASGKLELVYGNLKPDDPREIRQGDGVRASWKLNESASK